MLQHLSVFIQCFALSYVPLLVLAARVACVERLLLNLFYLVSGHWQLSAVVPPLDVIAGVQAGMRPIEVLSQRRFLSSGSGFSLTSNR